METKTFKQVSYYNTGGRYAPTVAEMKTELTTYLRAHPSINRTLIRQHFDKHGHQLLYTPPYQPNLQPIEMVWAYTKNYVARQYQPRRSMTLLQEDVMKGFYGDGKLHAGMTEALAKDIIGHAIKYCNTQIEEDDALDGTMDDLKTESVRVEPDVEQDVEIDECLEDEGSDGE
jgi:hypothetical protein